MANEWRVSDIRHSEFVIRHFFSISKSCQIVIDFCPSRSRCEPSHTANATDARPPGSSDTPSSWDATDKRPRHHDRPASARPRAVGADQLALRNAERDAARAANVQRCSARLIATRHD